MASTKLTGPEPRNLRGGRIVPKVEEEEDEDEDVKKT